MHSCLNWNYAIKVFDIGKVRPKWLTARIKWRPALRLLNRGCEVLLRIDTPFSEARRISKAHHLFATGPEPAQVFGWMQLFANMKHHRQVWDGSPNGPLYSLTAALTSVIYWSLHTARCAAVYCNLQQGLLPFSDVCWVVKWLYYKNTTFMVVSVILCPV